MSRDRTVGETFYIAFTTRAFATGVPTVLAGTPVISAYEDAGLTQITAGITLGVDHDSVVGLNMLTIVATGANGYEAGKDYNLVITTGTVGGVSVAGEVIGQFSLGLSASFTRIGAAGAGLTAINLPNQTMDIIGDITGNLSGSVGSNADINTTGGAIDVVTLVTTTTTNTDMVGTDGANTTVPDAAGTAPTAAEINAEMVDVMKTDTIAEQAQGVPPTTPTFEQAVMYLYMALTKEVDVDATLKEFSNNAGTVIWKKTLSDDGTNYNEAKGATGP